jgi:hypothetical protein
MTNIHNFHDSELSTRIRSVHKQLSVTTDNVPLLIAASIRILSPLPNHVQEVFQVLHGRFDKTVSIFSFYHYLFGLVLLFQ